MQDLGDLFSRVSGGEKEISWSSFLFASLNASLLSSGNLQKTFEFLDTNQKGYLTKEDFKDSMCRRGQTFSGENNIDSVLLDAKVEGEKIDFLKFCQIMGLHPEALA